VQYGRGDGVWYKHRTVNVTNVFGTLGADSNSFVSASRVQPNVPVQHFLPPVCHVCAAREHTKQTIRCTQSKRHTGAIKQACDPAYGGYGKTIAAILYAHEYAAQYPRRPILPVDGEDRRSTPRACFVGSSLRHLFRGQARCAAPMVKTGWRTQWARMASPPSELTHPRQHR